LEKKGIGKIAIQKRFWRVKSGEKFFICEDFITDWRLCHGG